MKLNDPSGHICVNGSGNDEVAMAGNCNGKENKKYTGSLLGNPNEWKKKVNKVNAEEPKIPSYNDNRPSCTNCTYAPQEAPKMNPKYPDYKSFTLSIGEVVGGTLVLISDRYGNIYLGLGANAGKSITPVSGSLTAGWIGDPFDNHYPDENSSEAFLTGLAINGSAGVLGGGGVTISPTSNIGIFGFEVGFYSPQLGVSIVGSGLLFDN